jgi:GR25 family glycosyltransferase involved in LPS biosynthesis
MKDTDHQSLLFSQQKSFNPNSLLALVPYIPERGYIGTNSDRKYFLQMSKVCLVRPAYLVRLVERYRGYRTFYTLMINCNSFQHVRDKIKFDYRDKKYTPEIMLIAQLMPLQSKDL